MNAKTIASNHIPASRADFQPLAPIKIQTDDSSQTANLSKLLSPQTQLDIVISSDSSPKPNSVRRTMILEVNRDRIVAGQTDPRITKARTGQEVEVTAVYYDQKAGECSRWGWPTTILGTDNNYQFGESRNSPPLSVVFLSLPPQIGPRKVNLRQSQRLETNPYYGIIMEQPSAETGLRLLNFSAGGFMVSTNLLTLFHLGQEVPFKFIFPDTPEHTQTIIQGQAMAVRMEYDNETQNSRIGLKFLKIHSSTSRSMDKIIDYYLLADPKIHYGFEQRSL